MPALRAAVLPWFEGLTALQDIWSAKFGPGGRRAVEAGGAAGYKLGVEDMENTPVYRAAHEARAGRDRLPDRPGGHDGGHPGRDARRPGHGGQGFLAKMQAESGDEADRG